MSLPSSRREHSTERRKVPPARSVRVFDSYELRCKAALTKHLRPLHEAVVGLLDHGPGLRGGGVMETWSEAVSRREAWCCRSCRKEQQQSEQRGALAAVILHLQLYAASRFCSINSISLVAARCYLLLISHFFIAALSSSCVPLCLCHSATAAAALAKQQHLAVGLFSMPAMGTLSFEL